MRYGTELPHGQCVTEVTWSSMDQERVRTVHARCACHVPPETSRTQWVRKATSYHNEDRATSALPGERVDGGECGGGRVPRPPQGAEHPAGKNHGRSGYEKRLRTTMETGRPAPCRKKPRPSGCEKRLRTTMADRAPSALPEKTTAQWVRKATSYRNEDRAPSALPGKNMK